MTKTKTSAKPFSPIIIRSSDNLSHAIRRMRKLQGLSQIDLAKKAGVTQAMISRVERGSHHTEFGTVISLLAALNADLLVTNRLTSKKDEADLEGLF